MSLSKRLRTQQTSVEQRIAKPTAAANEQSVTATHMRKEIRERVHKQAIDTLDLRILETDDVREVRPQLLQALLRLLQKDREGARLEGGEQQSIAEAIVDEMTGFGPLESILKDPDVSDILINRFDQVYVERKGKLELSSIHFNSNAHLLQIIQRIVSRIGRRVDESSPMVDARLPDGSRVNAIIPPLAVDGPCMSIRRFGQGRLGPADLVRHGAISSDMMAYLYSAVKARSNIVISGGTGSGKTTMLNLLSSFIPEGERVVTAEDATELNLYREHVVRLESRPPNIEGEGAIPIRALVKNAMRMRPDRIIIGEVRGPEVLDMLQAMNTGHEGSMATIHANSPEEAGSRLMMMLALAGVNLSGESMAQFVADSVGLIVQIKRFADGARRTVAIAEVRGAERERVLVENIFECNVTMEGGKSKGVFVQKNSSHNMDTFARSGFPYVPGTQPYLGEAVAQKAS